MENLFGVPVTSIMLVLVSIFALCMLVGVWIVLRHRIVFKLGVRNIPRRPAQTTLIVIGLMLSTLIISAAFTTGDTLNNSIRSQVYDILGTVDVGVVLASGEDADSARPQSGVTLPQTVADELAASLASDSTVAGVIAIHSERVPVLNARSGLSEPALAMIGVPPGDLEPFGGIEAVDGSLVNLAAIPDNGVLLGEKPAGNLDAVVGDQLTLFVNNQPHDVVVAAIVKDWLLTGFQNSGEPGGFTMPLERAQAIFERPGEINYIGITNRGGVRDGVHLSDQTVATINSHLDGTPYRAVAFKQDALNEAEAAANLFLSLFVIFGLFSISVGILLIFLIFVMLAAERQSEMGMARAVGMRRRQLIQMFMSEGIAYNLIAAMVGALLGVGVAFIMVGMLARLFDGFLEIRPAVTWTSLVITYTLGVIVTFITILISSWRVSKLTIVTAIRNLPDPPRKRAGGRTFLLGAGGVVVGSLLIWLGLASRQEFPFSLGMSMIPFSLALAARRFGVSPRLGLSLASILVLFYWLMPFSWSDRLLPELSGEIEMFFISGIILVGSATTLVIWNATLATGLVVMLGRRFSRWLPSVKTAIAYPLANKLRTGMTVAMFSLVVFSLVMMAAINTNLLSLLHNENAGGGWNIHAYSSPNNPLADLVEALETHGMDTSVIAATGTMSVVFDSRADIRNVGEAAWAGYTINGVDSDFITQSTIPFQIRAAGYDSDEAIWQALLENPHLAVIDSWALPTGGVTVDQPGSFRLDNVFQRDSVMDPVTVEIHDPVSGNATEVTIIGVMDGEVSTLQGVFLAAETLESVFVRPSATVFTVRIQEGADEQAVANQIESTLATFGIQAISLQKVLDDSVANSQSILMLFQGFMGLGLIVGIAALGVIAFRSVVERRQQIGMLRAIGYNRRMVAGSFMIESSLITLLGVVTGAVLGLVLSWNLLTSDYFLGSGQERSYIVPWGTVFFFLTLSLAASLIMAWIPARQAARVPISQALRYE